MIIDTHNRIHDYLRISLTEQCNLRCLYCMPEEGVQLSPTSNIMQCDEILAIAQIFVNLGIKKIRLTGGEPMLRKDFSTIVDGLSALPITLAITTNGILIEKYLELFTSYKIQKVNISLDTLKEDKFQLITRRNYFLKTIETIHLLQTHGIRPKINVVLIKGINDDEILDFIELTREQNISIQFIEYMPFSGNEWHKDKCVSYQEILDIIGHKLGHQNIEKEIDDKNDTSKKFKIKNYLGSFGIVSTVTNPFCDTCNRIRLTADGKIKNCLFSTHETDILQAYRRQENIESIIHSSILSKEKSFGGIQSFTDENKSDFEKNRSMILIGG